MPDVNPFDVLAFVQRLREAVQAVSDNAEDALNACLGQCFRDEIGDVFDPHDARPFRFAEMTA